MRPTLRLAIIMIFLALFAVLNLIFVMLMVDDGPSIVPLMIPARSARGDLQDEVDESMTDEISVYLSSALNDLRWWGGDLSCPWGPGRPPVRCEWHGDVARKSQSTAIWSHLIGEIEAKSNPRQISIGETMESGVYYPVLNDERFMSQFDITMTYRMSSDVYMSYYLPIYPPLPLVPLQEKISAIAYSSRNCATNNGREIILRELAKLGRIPVHSFSSCDNNREWPPGLTKVALFKPYKFCVAMENSNEEDYVTEKIWDALQAGCIPIYYGAPNIADFLPVPIDEIVIDYGSLSGPEELMAVMERLDRDDAAYNRMMAWRTMQLNETLPTFQRIVSSTYSQNDIRCLACRKVALIRAERQHT